jgi:hypothetical protein
MFIINATRSCYERTILHCFEFYLYYIILVNKKIKKILRSETREKINRQYTYIVENIKCLIPGVYELWRVFLTCFAASGNELLYFPTINVYCIYRGMSKAQKKLSNCLKRAETSVVLIDFDCILCEVRTYKFISINAVTVSYRHSTWIRYQKTISWSITKYSKTYPVNATAQIEQVQDKKNKWRDGEEILLKHLMFQSCDYPHFICISFRKFDGYIYIIL